MKVPFEKLDKAFENRLRLQIMSVLMVNDRYDFNSLKELLDTTDGNLASHLKGKTAFKQHLDALEQLIKQQKAK